MSVSDRLKQVITVLIVCGSLGWFIGSTWAKYGDCDTKGGVLVPTPFGFLVCVKEVP